MIFPAFFVGVLVGFLFARYWIARPNPHEVPFPIRTSRSNKKMKPVVKDDAAAVALEEKTL